MTRLFKILVDVVIVVCILSVIAVVVPPLVGVTTEISEPTKDTNYSEGSVAYGTKRPVASLAVGDEIICSGDTYAYIYSVESVDTDTGEVSVVDKTTGETGILQIPKNAIKKAVVIPVIGYIMIAMESENGRMMLICAAAVLIMLFVTALVLDSRRKKDKFEEEFAAEEAENEEDAYFEALTRSMQDKSNKRSAKRPQPAKTGAVTQETKLIQPEPAAETAAEPAQEFVLEPADPAKTASDAVAAPTIIMETPIRKEQPVEASEEQVEDMLKELRGELSENTETGTEAGDPSLAEMIETIENSTKDTAPMAAAAAAAKAETAVKAEPAQPAKAASAAKTEQAAAAQTLKAAPAAKAASQPETEDYRYIPPVSTRELNTENIAAAFADVPEDMSAASHDMDISEIPDVSAALEAALDTTQISRSERTYQPQPAVQQPQEPEEVDEIELAIPVRTAEEILDEAYGNGYDPQVIQDNVTGLKLIDFTDCFAEAK